MLDKFKFKLFISKLPVLLSRDFSIFDVTSVSFEGFTLTSSGSNLMSVKSLFNDLSVMVFGDSIKYN